MNKSILGALLGAAGVLVVPAAFASDTDMYNPGTTHLAVDAGLAFGGDKLAEVTFTDGSKKSINAGDAVFADIGVLHNFADTNWSFKGTIGYAFTTVHASNGDFTFDRTPIDLLAIYNHGEHHFGLGLTYHMSPSLDLSGFAPNVDFDNATGYILQYQYWIFGVRYTSISYKVSSSFNCIANCNPDGSSLGVFMSYAF